MYIECSRELPVIKAYYNDKCIGTYLGMHMANINIPRELIGKVSFRFEKVSQKSNSDLYFQLLREGKSR